jgi:hypothetical protein
MKTEFKVGLSFEVWIDLSDFDGREITEQDIQNAFGSLDPVSDGGVKYYIKEHLTPEDIFEHGNVQTGRVTYVSE